MSIDNFECEREINTMIDSSKVTSPSLVAYGVLTICLGMALSASGTFMNDPIREELGYLLAEVFTGLCLVIASVFVGVMRTRIQSPRNVAIYLLAWTASVACWFVCWILQPSTEDFSLLLSLTGLHGLFWGLWCVGLAMDFSSLRSRAAILCLFGGTTCSLGIIIATRTGIGRLSAVTAASCFMLFLGIQTLATAALLHRQFEQKRVLVRQ
jgi:hypothetical protein